MGKIGNFIDIEKFVIWLYDNEYIEDSFKNPNVVIKTSTADNWKNYKILPSKKNIEDINEKTNFQIEELKILDLLLCVNNAKDWSKEFDSVPSTGKKILNILLLGRELDDENNNKFFCASSSSNEKVWEYLVGLSKNKKNIKSDSKKKFFYLPGRTVSVEQIDSVGKEYKNGIKSTAIIPGIDYLCESGLVEWVDKENGLCKLSFNGCKSFLLKNK